MSEFLQWSSPIWTSDVICQRMVDRGHTVHTAFDLAVHGHAQCYMQCSRLRHGKTYHPHDHLESKCAHCCKAFSTPQYNSISQDAQQKACHGGIDQSVHAWQKNATTVYWYLCKTEACMVRYMQDNSPFINAFLSVRYPSTRLTPAIHESKSNLYACPDVPNRTLSCKTYRSKLLSPLT